MKIASLPIGWIGQVGHSIDSAARYCCSFVYRITQSTGEVWDAPPGVAVSIVLALGRYGWTGGPETNRVCRCMAISDQITSHGSWSDIYLPARVIRVFAALG